MHAKSTILSAIIFLFGCTKPYGSYVECLNKTSNYNACQWFYQNGYYGKTTQQTQATGLANQLSAYPKNKPMSYEQLSSIKVGNQQCKDMDLIIEEMKNQLRMKGLENSTPEDLNDADRQYNATVRIIIWSLIIGCNNPGRYAK